MNASEIGKKKGVKKIMLFKEAIKFKAHNRLEWGICDFFTLKI